MIYDDYLLEAMADVAYDQVKAYDRIQKFQKLMESIQSLPDQVRNAPTETIESKLREVSQSGMIQHPFIAYVPGAEMNIKLRNSGTELHSVQYGLYDKLRGVDVPGVMALRNSPKLTAKEESMLEEAHQFMGQWMDFVSIGEGLSEEADFDTLSPSVRLELQEKYLNNHEKIQNAGQSAYKLIGVLSQKKYGNPSTVGRLA